MASWMRRSIERIRAAWAGRLPDYHVSVDASGFTVIDDSGKRSFFSTPTIERVVAVRKWFLGRDTIFLNIEAGTQFVSISEDDPGYLQLVDWVLQFDGADPTFMQKLPTTGENFQTLVWETNSGSAAD